MLKDNLRVLRQAKGLTLQQLGEMVGYPSSSARQQVHRWESGQRDPALATLIKLSKALDCTLDDLAK